MAKASRKAHDAVRNKRPDRAAAIKRRIANWWSRNPEKTKAYNCSNHSRRRTSKDGSVVSPSDLLATKDYFCGLCAYCLAPLQKGFHYDHVQPLARGGAHHIDNIVPACPDCNRSKHARGILQMLRSG